MKKITTDSTVSPVRIMTTVYLMGTYVNDTLQFIANEEGRARVTADSSAVVYDYFLKDHLGNVRMVLTEETRTDAYPAATMETATNTIENTLYDNISPVEVPRGYPSDTPPGNEFVARVKGNYMYGSTSMEVGPGKLLKVMAGDTIHLTCNSWWNSGLTPSTPSNSYIVNQLLNAITGSAALPQSSHYNPVDLYSSTELNGSIASFLNNQSYNTSKPKAFVNYIAFDERFNYVANSSGFEQVGADSVYTSHILFDLPITKNGFVYVYVSNETPDIEVFFDNLQVTHVRGPLLEENHYYPFGLTMAGISSKALIFGDPGNKFKYNGKEEQTKEFTNGSGLETYDFSWRMYDQQIGRWHQIDPEADGPYNVSYSPFNYVINNPIALIDPDGRNWEFAFSYNKKGELTGVTIHFTGAVINNSDLIIGDAKMNNLAAVMESQIESAFSGSSSGVTVTAIASIRAIKNEKDLKGNEHLIRISNEEVKDDKGKNYAIGKGVSEIFGKETFINSAYVDAILNNTDVNLVPHEVGHTGGLLHPDANYFNINSDLFLGWWQVITQQKSLVSFDRDEIANGWTSRNLMSEDPGDNDKDVNAVQISAMISAYKMNLLNKNTIDGVKQRKPVR